MEYNFKIVADLHFAESNLMVNIPEQCPICGKNMMPYVRTDIVTVSDRPIRNTGTSHVYQASFITRCTHCFHLYTNIFEIYPDNQYRPQIFKGVYFEYFETRMPTVNVKLPEIINSISPKFVKIYTQALQAEKLNLDELSGMGLRKAIEFLIKDYAIKMHPEKEQEIKNLFLGKVISEFIEDNTLKELADGAVWIANDETHYVKEWPDKDIEDIKQYIECFINYIELKSSIADIEDMRKKREKRKTKVN